MGDAVADNTLHLLSEQLLEELMSTGSFYHHENGHGDVAILTRAPIELPLVAEVREVEELLKYRGGDGEQSTAAVENGRLFLNESNLADLPETIADVSVELEKLGLFVPPVWMRPPAKKEPPIAIAEVRPKEAVKKPDSDNRTVVVGSSTPWLIELVDAGEFDTVPKYMRGRLAPAAANAIVSQMNRLLEAKYQLIKTNFQRLSKANKDKVLAYREQECEQTEGRFFLEEKQLKVAMSTSKEASTLRQVLPILRHLRRITEVRSRTFVRFVVIN